MRHHSLKTLALFGLILLAASCGESIPDDFIDRPWSLTPRPHPGTDPDPSTQVPTSGGSNDADGLGENSETRDEQEIGRIRCGETPCEVGKEKCVVCSNPEVAPRCISLGSNEIPAGCGQASHLKCDGHEDCAGGRVCHYGTYGTGYQLRCVYFGPQSCGHSWRPICYQSSDCSRCTGKTRCILDKTLGIGLCLSE